MNHRLTRPRLIPDFHATGSSGRWGLGPFRAAGESLARAAVLFLLCTAAIFGLDPDKAVTQHGMVPGSVTIGSVTIWVVPVRRTGNSAHRAFR